VLARERVVERTALVALAANTEPRFRRPPQVTVRLLPAAAHASDHAETYARTARPPRAPLVDVYA
jgi:hypothetical protein